MRKLLTFYIILIALFTTHAQLREMLPSISPDGLIKQKIGHTEFEVQYGRPAARGRKVFGELVPYGQVWRTGAGESSKLKFDKPVTIGGKSIPAGTYALVTIPNPTHWTILLNSNTKKIFGAQQDGYDIETEVVRLNVPAQKTEYFYESFTIEVDILNNNAEMLISWENTQVHFTILTNNNEEALKIIQDFLAIHQTDADNLSYAAYYLDMNNQEPEQLLTYIDRALKIKEDWWFYEMKMNALAKAKRYDEARKTFQTATDYLYRTKPNGWEGTVQHFKGIMVKWE